MAEASSAGISDAEPSWEENIYGKQRHLNKYPYDVAVRFAYRNFSPDAFSSTSILEVGCGAGNNAWFLAREGFQVSGIDGSDSAISFARKRLQGDGLSADLKVGDFSTLPWQDGQFDAVIDRCAITHNHRDKIGQTFAEVRRVLKPGGLFLSQMFSSSHQAIEQGQPFGDGSYDCSTGSFFNGIRITFFAGPDDISQFFDDAFEIEERDHVVTEAHAGGETFTEAHWNVQARARS